MKPNPDNTYSYDYYLGPTPVRLSAQTPLDKVNSLLSQTVRLSRQNNLSEPASAGATRDEPLNRLQFTFLNTDSLRIPPQATGKLTQTGPLKGYSTEDGFYSVLGDSSLHVMPDRSLVSAQLVPEFWTYSLYFQRQFFLMAFFMLLRQQGQYGIHANGVIIDNTPCLIAGNSGCGKSTLTLSLILQHWSFWGDDSMIMRQDSDNNALIGFSLRCGSACSAFTSTLSPTLEAFYAKAPGLQDDKRLLPTESLPGIECLHETSPAIMIFPEIRDQSHSEIFEMDQTTSMARLIGLSAGILTNKLEVQRQMTLLSVLASQTKAFHLTQGRDVFDSPEQVAALIKSAIRD